MARIAIVTGASSGVGREFVRQLDSGSWGALDEIWLVARRREALENVASGLRAHGRVVPLDLTSQAAYERLAELLDEEDPDVRWLVNSAGFGKLGAFHDIGEKPNADMVRLNCLGVVEACYHVLPHMGAGSRIVNLASIAGVIPQPYLSVYSATKSFVLDFSRTLDHELAPSDIRVTALCPKWMRTGFLDDPGDEESVRRLTTVGFESVEHAVRCGLRYARRGRSLCIPSWDMKAAHVICQILPASWVMYAEDFFENMATARLV